MVLNRFPSIESRYKLAIVGDSPLTNEQSPFTSGVGSYLTYALQSANAMSSCCFKGNLVQVVCPGDSPSRLHKQSVDYVDGLEKIREDLQTFQPNCVLIVGADALKVAGIPYSNLDYRGTIFECKELESPFFGYKCVATANLSKLNINYDLLPLFCSRSARVSFFNLSRPSTSIKIPFISMN